MQPIAISCPKSLRLLSLFLDGKDGEHPIELEMVDAAKVPPPFDELLVHDRDMTSTLGAFHGQEITLDVLQQRHVNKEVLRNVVLRGKRDGQPVEYGVIRIRLPLLPEQAREAVLVGQEPLGGILNASATRYRSCPGGFLRIRPHPRIVESLGLMQDGQNGMPRWLFGRCNCLSNDSGQLFAEVVEILPPAQVDRIREA